MTHAPTPKCPVCREPTRLTNGVLEDHDILRTAYRWVDRSVDAFVQVPYKVSTGVQCRGSGGHP